MASRAEQVPTAARPPSPVVMPTSDRRAASVTSSTDSLKRQDQERAQLISQVVDDELEVVTSNDSSLSSGKSPARSAGASASLSPASVGGQLSASASRVQQRQQRPVKRRIRFRPAFLLTCAGLFQCLLLLTLIVNILLLVLHRDCPVDPHAGQSSVASAATTESASGNATSASASRPSSTAACIRLWPVILVNGFAAVMITIHLCLYVWRVVLQYVEFPWHIVDAVSFLLLAIGLATGAAFLLPSTNNSGLLLSAAVLSCLSAVLLTAIAVHRVARHCLGRPVSGPMFDDECDMAHVRRPLRFQQITMANVRRYWLL